MTAAQSPRYVPYDEFAEMEAESEGKHEWVDGVVYAMTRGTIDHGKLTLAIGAELRAMLRGDGCTMFASDTPLFIEAAKMHTYADAIAVCGEPQTRPVYDRSGKKMGEAITNPTIIVEVLSDGGIL